MHEAPQNLVPGFYQQAAATAFNAPYGLRSIDCERV
jgi:hypothetical protein